MDHTSTQELQLQPPVSTSHAVHHHGPVNYISHVDNAVFGDNHGSILQNSCQDLASVPGRYFPILVPISDASHTRNRRTSPPDSSCLPGTRTKVIQGILAWAGDRVQPGNGAGITLQVGRAGQTVEGGRQTNAEDLPSYHRPVLWLCGPVGCGKSAIAQTVAEELQRQQCLAGSFFFFRGSDSRSRFSRFIVTLATQIAMAIPEAEKMIKKAMKSTGVHGVSVMTQLERLIFGPFLHHHTVQQSTGLDDAESRSKRVFIVVIDGFDECEDREDVADFITHTLEFFERHPHTPLRFLISSRVEEHIRQRVAAEQVWTLNLSDYSSHADIMSIVCHTFSLAEKRGRVIASYGADWPGEPALCSLAKRADGSFIFIKTLLDFILGIGTSIDARTPIDRFNEALEMNGLDSLYQDILRRAQHIPYFPEVILSIATLGSELTVCDVALLAGIPPYKVVQILVPLQSIIRVPGDDDTTPIALFHTSLRDFLLDDRRCTLITHDQRLQHEELLAFRFIDIHLAMGAGYAITADIQAIQIAKENWERHWKGMQCRGDCRSYLRQMDHIFGLRDVVPEPHFLYILASCYWEILHRNEVQDLTNLQAPLRSILHSTSFPYHMPWLTREGEVLRRALSGLATHKPRLFLQDLHRRWQSIPPVMAGSAVHKRVVMYSIVSLLGCVDRNQLSLWGGSESGFPDDLIYCPPHDRLLQPWIRHLYLAIDECPTEQELRELLCAAYRGPLGQRTAFVSMDRQEMNMGVDLVVKSIGSKLPSTLERTPLVKCTGDSSGIMQSPDGLTVAGVLDVFRFLRIPEDYPALRCKTVTVDTGKTNKLLLCSWLTKAGSIRVASYPYL